MNIIHATEVHIPQLLQYDRHISGSELRYLISRGRILIAEEQGIFCGWLRWNLFWDNTPFMNMLYLPVPHRGKSWGKALVEFWEEEMKASGYRMVLTSTQSDEYAQHFYQKLGYAAIGGFLLPGDPYEVIFHKSLE